MSQKVMWQDKLNELRISPSEQVWDKIENQLEKSSHSAMVYHRTIWGVVAAVLLVVIAYYMGAKSVAPPEYFPTSLEVSDQASQMMLPVEYRSPDLEVFHYRKGGYLIPNSRALWDKPLVPRVN